MTSKYNNRRFEFAGHTFDSKKEAHRYRDLKLREAAGEIYDLQIQAHYSLCCPSAIRHNESSEVSVYIADFTYHEDNRMIVEDCKGYRTALYRLKKKWMLLQYGITIRET